MKAEKNTSPAAVLPLPTPEPPAKPKPKRVRGRAAKVELAGGPGPVSAAEGAAARIAGLTAEITARAERLVEAQRGKPARWDYFAALADLEERLRRVLS